MTGDFWIGLAVLPAVALAAAILLGVLMVLAMLWGKFAPAHWWISLPRLGRRSTRTASDLLRYVDVMGGHASTVRPLGRFGPFGLWLIRHAPGHIETRLEPEHIP